MGANGYRDYFKVLGVERSADADAIKRAFRKLARQYHPDVNPDDAGAEAKFKEVSEAYEVLSDPDKRRRYEQFGQYWSQAGAALARAGWTLTSVATAISTISSTTCWDVLAGPPPAVPRAVSVLVRAFPVDLPGACQAVCLEGAAPLR